MSCLINTAPCLINTVPCPINTMPYLIGTVLCLINTIRCFYGNAGSESEPPSWDCDINRALGRTIWLKSGGYIIIDQTEALIAIDVNTGKYVGHSDPEDTILKTNLEALKEAGSTSMYCKGLRAGDAVDVGAAARESPGEQISDSDSSRCRGGGGRGGGRKFFHPKFCLDKQHFQPKKYSAEIF